MYFVTRDKVKICYDFFAGDSVVILLPGISENRQIWLKQLELLKSQNFGVLNVDFRNQGESQRTYRGQRIFQLASDVHELINYLKINRPIMIGHSMGAAVSFAYLALYGSTNITAVVDVDQSPKMINDENWKYGLKNLNWETFPELLKLPLPSPTWHGIRTDIKEVLTKIKKKNPYSPTANQALLIDNAFQDWRDVIAESECPFYFITGEYSPYFDHRFASAMVAIAKNADCTSVSNAGHIVMAEQPELFNKTLLSALNWISSIKGK
ncbi:hypothetical protein FC89_GL000587 [Liquorilactobacillus ghanensis DSM 18630]|uniref:AB hydrolase-1 domain-containing protein n=1 Tax=Liquorilactobacillus ghanensis DSM 18630 TaxID=1423750 RepID=A0A0R1VLA7_9LACO|nr:alpha/beta hydrolase [Liquorilactobacillus ghanensis]KRM06442.1 hypothetical protein FC89_GL000587 [Liquorilactobacillus ghanensis DSM 18630]